METASWREVFKTQIEQFGEPALALRGARKRDGYSQVQLAERSGIPQQHISEMENGKRPIGKKHAKLFADIFHTGYKVFL